MAWSHNAVIHEPEHFTAPAVVESVAAHGWLNSVEFAQVPAAVAAAKALMLGPGPFFVSFSGHSGDRHGVEVRVESASAPVVNAPVEGEGAEAVNLPVDEAPAAGAEPVEAPSGEAVV